MEFTKAEEMFKNLKKKPFHCNKNKNWNIYLQIFSLIFISSILTDIHLVIGSVLSDPIHRTVWSVGNDTILLWK